MRGTIAIGMLLLACACAKKVSLPDGASWDEGSRVFHWKGGEVRMPEGLTYAMVQSDTFEGEFKSKSGKLAIQHDIGAKAGAWAQRDGAVAFEERKVDGARVWIGQRARQHADMTERLFAVTFPDNGCANFFIESNNEQAGGMIAKIAESFKPLHTEQPPPEICYQRVKVDPLE